jgi:hypothetical protein
MKEAPAHAPKPRRRPQIRANLQRLRASRRQGMFGVAEILGLGVSALILIVVIISYIYFLVPGSLPTRRIAAGTRQTADSTSQLARHNARRVRIPKQP